MADAFYIATGAAFAAVAAECAAGWVGNHAQDIAASWHEGRDQVAVWSQAAVTQALYALGVVELWLLLHLESVRKGGA